MGASWTRTPTGVRRGTGGPGRAVSLAAGTLTVVGTTMALLISAAILFPDTYGGGRTGVAAPSPTAPAAAPATLAPAASLLPAATQPARSQASPRPSAAPAEASPDPAVSATPRPSRAPGGSPIPELAQMRETVPLTDGRREIGRVTVQAVREVRSGTTDVPAGKRLMVATIQIDSVASRLPYDELHWRLEDERGERWQPIVAAAPKPLGSGTLEPSADRTGGVAFLMPTDARIRAVVLTDGAGADLVVFNRPSVSG